MKTEGGSYKEAIDIDKLEGKAPSRDDTSVTETSSALSSYGYCDIESVDGAAAHLEGVLIDKCPRFEVNGAKRVTIATPKRPKCPGFWYTDMTPGQIVNSEEEPNAKATDNDDAVMAEPHKENESNGYNMRCIDKDLQEGMAEEEEKNKAVHKYAPKARNALKTSRKPSPEYEVKVAPPNQRVRFPFGTSTSKKVTARAAPVAAKAAPWNAAGNQDIIDLKDYKFLSPAPKLLHRPWPYLTQDSLESPEDSQNTQRSMEEKKAAPEKKRSEERKAPSMQKNLFADEPFNTLRGQFEAVQDNTAALESQFGDLMRTVNNLVTQNQAHLRQAGLVRKENEKISESVNKLENQVHVLKQRCCILEKLGKGIDEVREGMDKIS
jgi:hypothetical protein